MQVGIIKSNGFNLIDQELQTSNYITIAEIEAKGLGAHQTSNFEVELQIPQEDPEADDTYEVPEEQ